MGRFLTLLWWIIASLFFILLCIKGFIWVFSLGPFPRFDIIFDTFGISVGILTILNLMFGFKMKL